MTILPSNTPVIRLNCVVAQLFPVAYDIALGRGIDWLRLAVL